MYQEIYTKRNIHEKKIMVICRESRNWKGRIKLIREETINTINILLLSLVYTAKKVCFSVSGDQFLISSWVLMYFRLRNVQLLVVRYFGSLVRRRI